MIQAHQKGFLKNMSLVIAMGLGLASCDTRIDGFSSAPVVTGNTIDRFNDLEVIFPNAEAVNVSYLFNLVNESDLSVEGSFSGPAWLFSEQAPASPESFVYVHLITPEGAVLDEPSEIVRLGKRNFRSVIYCINPFAADLPITVQPYVDQIVRSEFALSGDMFIRRFTETTPGLDGRRFDLVYLHDIARGGYQCDDIGDDLLVPNDSMADELDGWKARAERSFEIIG